MSEYRRTTLVVIAFALLAAMLFAKAGPKKPTLVVLVSPRISQAGVGSASPVTVTAVLAGPEDEQFYCPQVVFIAPDGTESREESDCAPFEHRNECWPALPPGCAAGWHRDASGAIMDNDTDRPECVCNITGYPKRWRRVYNVPSCPYETQASGYDPCGYEVKVELRKQGRVLLRQSSPSFFVR
jgi:hypothetical protein